VQPPDLMPTFLDLAGAPDPGTMHGRSLVPVLRGASDRVRDFCVTSPSIIDGAGGGERVTITTDEWSFICAADPRAQQGYISLAVDGLPKRMRIDAPVPSELYHLATDPGQTQDVIDEHPDVAAELRSRFVRFLAETGTCEQLIAPWRNR
jgi:arylsulfatase A-like enzyme